MTDLVIPRPRPRQVTATGIQIGTVATGFLILIVRPAIAASVGWTTTVVVTVFVIVLAMGLAAPVDHAAATHQSSGVGLVWIFAAGGLVFLVGRLLAAGHAPAPATATLMTLNTLAAVAEEALFRRVTFGLLLRAGPIAAVGGSGLLFALAHLTVYGWWAMPVDVAAGIVLGWQRWVSGSWLVPAGTHALADLLVVI